MNRKLNVPRPRVRTGESSPQRRPLETGRSPAPDINPDPLLTEAEAAAYLNYRRRTLASWRRTGRGPRFVAVSRTSRRYRKSDLDAFIVSKLRHSTSDDGEGEA